MIISLDEILSLVIITGVLGYIFSGFIQRPREIYEIRSKFDWKDIQFAMIVAAPAVILHEFGHKFVAIFFGLDATFHIFWMGLALGVVMKLLSLPFLILAPAYVSIPSGATALQGAWIAFAGPAVNLAIWGVSALILKYKKKMTRLEFFGWAISKKLNFLLFWFNLIPIPPLDGWSVLNGLISAF
jgi:Zn-dependent protease